jgi:hypothetical protein
MPPVPFRLALLLSTLSTSVFDLRTRGSRSMLCVRRDNKIRARAASTFRMTSVRFARILVSAVWQYCSTISPDFQIKESGRAPP